jgi:hypothetical protein
MNIISKVEGEEGEPKQSLTILFVLGKETCLGFYVGGVSAQCSRNIGDGPINVAPSTK